MLMTSVSGHLTATKFTDEYERDWSHPPPDALFDAPVLVKVEEVRDHPRCGHLPGSLSANRRTRNPSLIIFPTMREDLVPYSSGPIVIEKESTSVVK